MHTEPVASLRQGASGPALANLDLAMAFPLADGGTSFIDRLEAASNAASNAAPKQAEPEVDDREKSRRAEKEREARSSRTPSKKPAAESNAPTQEQPLASAADPSMLRETPVVGRTDAAAPDTTPVDDSAAADGPAAHATDDQASHARAGRAAADDRRNAKPSRPQEPATDAAPAEPSMRQTRLEAESSRRVEARDQSRAANDASTGDTASDGRHAGTSGGGWQAPSIQRQAPAEAFVRDSGAIKATGEVRDASGPATGAMGPRVGHARGGSTEARGAKDVKRQGPSFPAPQAQESTMVLRTGKALAAALRGAGDVRLNLSPEELGRVQVRMHSDQEGVSVVLGCERPETVASLESGVASLRRTLEEQGVRVKDIVVEGPRAVDGPRPADAPGESSAHDRPAAGFEQGARDDGRHELPARRESMAHAGSGDADDDTDTVVVDRSVGTLLASLDAAGVSTAIDTVV